MNHDWHDDRKQRHKSKLTQILKVAAYCFNKEGLAGTSLKDVANQLNITDAALYYYIKNKEELINLCYLRALDLGFDCLDRALALDDTPLEKLKFYIRAQIETICDPNIGPLTVLTDIPSLRPEFREPIIERFRIHTNRLSTLLTEGMEAGLITEADPRLVTSNIMGAINWIPKWYHADLGQSADEIADSFIQIYCRGLEPRN